MSTDPPTKSGSDPTLSYRRVWRPPPAPWTRDSYAALFAALSLVFGAFGYFWCGGLTVLTSNQVIIARTVPMHIAMVLAVLVFPVSAIVCAIVALCIRPTPASRSTGINAAIGFTLGLFYLAFLYLAVKVFSEIHLN